MRRIVNIIGGVTLVGTLLHLCFVFWFLFDELDKGNFIGKITGITFAFASIWFVIKAPGKWLKIIIVILDGIIILYFYLHELWKSPIQYIAIIVAIYSVLTVFYVGRIVNEQTNSVTESETNRLRNELNRLRIENELRELGDEIKKTRRRITDSRGGTTRKAHEKKLESLENEYNQKKSDNLKIN